MEELTINEQREGFSITNDRDQLDLVAIHEYLTQSYWSPGIPIEVVANAVKGSVCFGLFEAQKQIGFARVVTDRATFAYLCDVYVLEEYRGRGLAKWLMEVITKYVKNFKLRRFLLATRDAHGLYEKFGFKPLAKPESFMEIHRPDVYLNPG